MRRRWILDLLFLIALGLLVLAVHAERRQAADGRRPLPPGTCVGAPPRSVEK